MKKKLWRQRGEDGREHSFWEARAKFLQYSLSDVGMAGLKYLGILAGTGLVLKGISDIVSGEYSGNIIEQGIASIKDAVPYLPEKGFEWGGFKELLAKGAVGVAFGEFYSWGKERVIGKGKNYNAVAIQAAAENAPIRDERRERTAAAEQSELEDVAMNTQNMGTRSI